jgi:hypothetical protein
MYFDTTHGGDKNEFCRTIYLFYLLGGVKSLKVNVTWVLIKHICMPNRNKIILTKIKD